MKLTRVEGPPTTLVCLGCKLGGTGGTDIYKSAATGEDITPDTWYQNSDRDSFCSTCAAGFAYEDPTRSVTQFYADTAGTEILPEPK